MAYDLALYLSTAALASVSFWRHRLRLNVVNAVQGAWVVLICMAVALQYSGVQTLAKERLFTSTTIVNVALLALVVLQSRGRYQEFVGRLRRMVPEEPAAKARTYPLWFWVLLTVSLGLFVLHAILMPSVPLAELIFNSNLEPMQLVELREQANKTLGVPLPLKYLFNWNFRVFVPILLVFLVVRARLYLKLVSVPLLLALNAMTLEKSLPAFAVIACGFAVAIYRQASVVSRPVLVGIVFGLGLAAGLNNMIGTPDQSALSGEEGPGFAKEGDSPGEQSTVEPSSEGDGSLVWRVGVEVPARFIYRRVLRIPAEVAYAWFEYFPEISNGFMHGRSWFSVDRTRPGFEHPAQLVGLHAYYAKDPAHYLPTVHAYGAFHADAWANFGYWGVAVASILLIIILAVADMAIELTRSLLSAAAGGAGLSILVTTLPAGGLQAALVAQGLVVCLAIMLAPIWQGFKSARNTTRGHRRAVE